MGGTLSRKPGTDEQRRIAETFRQEQPRLRNFPRKRVSDDEDIEDILQDESSELVEAYRLMQSIEQVGAWLFRVAENRIIDRFRKKQPEPMPRVRTRDNCEDEGLSWEEMLPESLGVVVGFALVKLVGHFIPDV